MMAYFGVPFQAFLRRATDDVALGANGCACGSLFRSIAILTDAVGMHCSRAGQSDDVSTNMVSRGPGGRVQRAQRGAAVRYSALDFSADLAARGASNKTCPIQTQHGALFASRVGLLAMLADMS